MVENFGTIYIDGEPFYPEDPDVEYINVERYKSGAEPTHQCRNCGEPVTNETSSYSWVHADSQSPECYDGADIQPEPIPLAWCNSVGIHLDENEDSISVKISVADPRGGFFMTVCRLDDGRLVMRLPHPSDGAPHATLKEVRPGTYEVSL